MTSAKELLTTGVQAFRKDGYTKRKGLFDKLKSGQSPKVLFITCSDSRVVPSLITNTEPGDLFVIRNAGNMIPGFQSTACGEEATVEYAVAALGVEHIIVCGHSSCGAMGGLLNPDAVASVPSVAKWLELARPSKQAADALCTSSTSKEERLKLTIEINALRQLDSLRGHPSVAAALAAGKVELHAWVYDIGSGSVRSYDAQQKKYVELKDELYAATSYLSHQGLG